MHHSCRLFFWRLLPIISSLTLCTASTNAATNTGSSFPIKPSPRLAMSRCGPAAYGGEMHTITPRHPRREVSCTFDPFRRLVFNKILLDDAMFIRKRKRKIQTLRGGRVIVMSLVMSHRGGGVKSMSIPLATRWLQPSLYFRPLLDVVEALPDLCCPAMHSQHRPSEPTKSS